ncbi:Molecular chaperone (Small heat shock protein) [Frankia canadensis]|uniref:Molecular chaperone (Small heat shock protein) n=1 Tax=Frankia canadensis TaxID=1836972 RepID=A0A2I2KVH1_9ACTN|nr:Hsp20/alpha crystallin family protein [Frankia canadensis]SNQ49667.1 Molecular chaperone (Small heat shock protein) [Frankia canadensis]SOU56957.1 Molecular chaperone (Small heat shock protein) [Frankia canadensis]
MTLSMHEGAAGSAPPARWDPFREIEEVWSRMGSLLGDVAGGAGRPLGVLAGTSLAVDVEETDDAFIVELELPGVRRDDLSIDLRERELHVAGEVRERERTGIVRRRSRRTGSFEHRVTLPGDVDPDRVEATLTDGVLTVTLPKAHRSQPRHIEIATGAAAGPGGGADREATAVGGATDSSAAAPAAGRTGPRPSGYGSMTTGDAARGGARYDAGDDAGYGPRGDERGFGGRALR